MGTISTHHSDSQVEPALRREAPVTPPPIRMLLAFTSDRQPPCRVLAALKGLRYDLIGPIPVGSDMCEMVSKERPSLVTLRIDHDTPASFEWISLLWNTHKVPVAVVTLSEDPAIYFNSANAGAFCVIREDSPLEIIQAAIQIAAQRGAELLEANDRVAKLERNLLNRRLVEQAKWAVVQRNGLTEPEAHIALQSLARAVRRPLAEIAQAVADGASLESLRSGNRK